MTRRLFLLAAAGVADRGDLTTAELVERYTEFCTAWDSLGEAANVFAKAYNQGKGTVWPLRESRALECAQERYEQAWRRLYASEAWISTRK